MKTKERRVYLDYASSTPIDPEVSKIMKEAEETLWQNPSALYQEGENSRTVLENARKEIGEILNCRAGEIYFTSGGTESANIAVQGILKDATRRLKERNALPHVVVTSIEHSAILEPLKILQKEEKIELSIINPDERGIVNPTSVEMEIKENTVLVCVMHANNEIGTIQPVGKIGSSIKEFRNKKELKKEEPLLPYPYFLVDASQSALYENVSVERLGADILILDGIKIYGPRGTGILVVKHGVGMAPVIWGGGQEKGIRPGTENVVGAVGLAAALKIAVEKREAEVERLTEIRDYAIDKILKEIPGSSLNGDAKQRLPNNINMCFNQGSPLATKGDPWQERDSEFWVIKLDTMGFAVSSASSCLNLKEESSSYVIESLGKPECASSSLRFTLGRDTTKKHLDDLIKALKEIIK